MPDPNTALAPRYDIVDEARNWVYVGRLPNRETVQVSPYAVVVAAQRALGVPADGAIGPATANALKDDLQNWTNAPPSYAQKIDEAISSRRVNPTLWTLLVAKSGVSGSNDYQGIEQGEIALGTAAQLPDVKFPAWNSRAPGGPGAPRRTGTQTGTRTSPGTGTAPQGGPAASDAGASIGSQFSQFYERNKPPMMIGGAVLLVGGIAAAFLLMKDDKGGGSSGGMSPRKAASILGVREDSSPSAIRAAYAQSLRLVHPDYGYRGPDSAIAIRELQEARRVLESRSMQLGRSSGYLYEEDDEEYYSWGR